MNFDEIKELISLINESDLSYLEIKNEKDYIKMDKSMSRNCSDNNTTALGLNNDINSSNIKVSDKLEDLNNSIKKDLEDSKDDIAISKEDEVDIEYIKSPIVGTFYGAISPESDPFVSKGQKIKKGDVVCIIEAMKLMNEISAEFDCEIVDILGNNGKMVEYGSPLFKIRRV